MKKDAQYHSASLKYWNREASFKQGKNRITKGLSRSRSDAYSRAKWALGKGRQQQANLFKARSKFNLSRYGEGRGISRARGFRGGKGMSEKFEALLDKQRQIESSLDTTFGRNMDATYQKIQRNYLSQMAANRQRLGVKPEYGMPIMMPPKDKAGQSWANLQLALSIAGMAAGAAAGGAGAGGSDIRLKENIDQVGVSKSGHKIFEWNYISAPNTRYRGVIAQEVMKIDPMAVTIQEDNMLGVFYDKIDVNMEVV